MTCSENNENLDLEENFAQKQEAVKSDFQPVLYASIDTFQVKNGDTFGKIMAQGGVNYSKVHQIQTETKDIFDVTKLTIGNNYIFYHSHDGEIAKFSYNIDKIQTFNVYFAIDSMNYSIEAKEIFIKNRVFSGIIDYSLYQTIKEIGGNPLLVEKMVEIYGWVIDFFAIQKGDKFKLIVEEKYAGDEFIGYGKVFAAEFMHNSKPYRAINFDKNGTESFYDENGMSLRKAFLKSPLNFSRISSRFQKGRFHPVLHQVRDHLGTDYAAPTGTPIWSVADGIVVEAGYSAGNGNYVKIKHNGIYTTGYLHMSKIGKGIRKGASISQKQIIGYVGSTGLATGPHLCFRFWKNGTQVDPFKVSIPPSMPIEDDYKQKFNEFASYWENELAKVKL
ncbi:peptidoglycan DD-metalloendopeptidase family protein [bacterium]|nr:peptidoglycan DD-metalloendopeptidase family protein [bacterium]